MKISGLVGLSNDTLKSSISTLSILPKIKSSFTENNNVIEELTLDTPNKGLYIPPSCWHVMEYSHDSVQLVFASTLYDEKDYIRDYSTYKKYYEI